MRLPAAEADRLDRAAFERRTTKQDLIASLVASHLPAGGDVAARGEPRRVAVEIADDALTVGRHEFRPAPQPEVLTVPDAAQLLRTTEDEVARLAEGGELPGRRVAGEWRFARSAVLGWLAHA